MSLVRRCCLTIAALVAALAAHPASASARPDFRTPTQAAYCDLLPGWHANGGVEGGFINGEDADDAAIGCWTPNDGFVVRMSNTGPVLPKEYVPVLRGHTPKTHRVLRFGQGIGMRGITCHSRGSGLTCRNRSGHGWWLGRFVGYRNF
jgi:hypothetical protein